MKRRLVAVITTMLALALGSVASASVTDLIIDPFTNVTSQHATAVEPDTFAHPGTRTIVSVSQVGRFFNGGASGMGFATSKDGGATWTNGVIPGITVFQGGPWDRVSDPVIAYDQKHKVWLANSIALDETPGGGITVPRVLVNRSTDGVSWGGPIQVPPPPGGGSLDKNWIVCDNWAKSRFYGNCYVAFDIPGGNMYFSRSTDGGQTWSVPIGKPQGGVGIIPVVQPDGDVIAPTSNPSETAITAYRSTNGGVSWSDPVTISPVFRHQPAGSLRAHVLPSAEVDRAGRVYVVWQDCRFRASCSANDIVMSTSTDGVTWSPVVRIPIDGVTSGIDHFIPGIGVDAATSGASARLGLAYYFYRNARCGGKGATCQLEVGFVQSPNGGATWTAPTMLAGPFPVTWTANTNQGRMVGDYISTSWLGGKAWPAFSVAYRPPTPFDQTIATWTGGIPAAAPAQAIRSSAGERAVVSEPPPRGATVAQRVR